MKIDLLPQEYRPQPSLNVLKISLIIVLILTVFVSGWYLASDIMELKSLHENIQIALDELKVLQETVESKQNIQKVSEEIERKKKEIEILTGSHLQMGEILGEMSSVLPNNFWFESLSIDKNNNLMLKGGTNRLSAVANYAESIERSPLFKQVSIQSISASANENEYYRFEMDIALEKVGNAND